MPLLAGANALVANYGDTRLTRWVLGSHQPHGGG